MLHRIFTSMICISIFIVVTMDHGHSQQTPPGRSTIVLTDISKDAAKKIKRFQPLADYLAANLNDFGIEFGEVIIARDIETLTQWMASGKVDLYFDSLYPAMMVCDQSGAQPILRRWKSGIVEYHTIFFTRTDTGLTSLDDLKGKMIAFEDTFSTSGYMLPLAYLKTMGFNPVEKGQADFTMAENEIGYVFSGADQNVVQWVLSEKVAAGVTDNKNFLEIPEKIRNALTILAETQKVTRQVVVIRPNMDATLLETIKTLLMGLDETEEGRAILKKLKETAKFDDFPGGTEVALTRMRELYEIVQNR